MRYCLPMNSANKNTNPASDLATRIAKTPSAYVSRFNRIETAMSVASANPRVNGKTVIHRIFMGPVGEFWMTTSATIAAALNGAGYEKACEV